MMKNKSAGFPRHTHFISIPVPHELECLVQDCREYMNATYGCKSGFGTPPHITLVAPFLLPEGMTNNDVVNAAAASLEECCTEKNFPFTVRVNGFGSFAERTLFAHVEDSEQWQKNYSAFSKNFSRAIPDSIKKSSRRFYPHLSVANRDIPQGAMDSALKHFAELLVDETFTANEIAIYTRTPFGSWQEWRRLGK